MLEGGGVAMPEAIGVYVATSRCVGVRRGDAATLLRAAPLTIFRRNEWACRRKEGKKERKSFHGK